MRAPGLESLRLRTLREFWRRREVGARATLASRCVAGAAGRAIVVTSWAAIGARSARGGCITTRATIGIGTRRAIAVGATRWAVTTISAIGAIAAIVAVTLGELLGDGLEILCAWQDLKESALVGLAFDRGGADDA
jgi:hypothetical protein